MGWIECHVLYWTSQYVCPIGWMSHYVLDSSVCLSHGLNVTSCLEHLSMSVPWIEFDVLYWISHFICRIGSISCSVMTTSVCLSPGLNVTFRTGYLRMVFCSIGWIGLSRSVLNTTVCLSHGLNVTFFIEHLISWVECHFLCWTPQYVCFTCRTRTCAWASQHHRHRLAKPVLVCLSVCLPAYLTTCLPACLSLCLCHSSELYLHNALYTALRDHMPHMREHCMTMIIPDYFCYNLRCSRISVTTAFLYK